MEGLKRGVLRRSKYEISPFRTLAATRYISVSQNSTRLPSPARAALVSICRFSGPGFRFLSAQGPVPRKRKFCCPLVGVVDPRGRGLASVASSSSQNNYLGNSLAVQWLGLRAFTALARLVLFFSGLLGPSS